MIVKIVPIAKPRTLEELHTGVVGALQSLQLQLNQPQPAADLQMSGKRISNLADPAAARDAVNRDYLDRRLANVSTQQNVALGSTTSTTTVVTTMAIQISY